MANEALGAVQGFTAGYDWMDRVMQNRKTRAAEEADVAARRALAERMAQGPALATPETPAGGAIPTPGGPTTAPSFAGPTTNDPEVQQLESQVLQQTGREAIKRQDWDAFRNDLMRSAGAIGDPETVMQVDQYVQDLQMRGFKQNAGKAAMAAGQGDSEGAARFLQKAWGYIEDGVIPQVQPTQDGNLVLMPVGEEDGTPAGDPIVLTPESIGEFVAMTEDPAKFAQWKREFEEDVRAGEESRATQQQRVDLEAERLEETKRANKAEETHKRKKLEAEETGEATEWNATENRALTNDVQRQVNTRKEGGSDELYQLYEDYGNDISSNTIQIAKVLEDYDIPKALDIAERFAQFQQEQPDSQLGYDAETGAFFIQLADGTELDFGG